MKLASRLSRIQPSATLAVEKRAKELRASGVDVIGFGAGEPDFDTPAHIKDAAKAALDRGQTKYTPVAGTPELRAAVAQWLSLAHEFSIAADQVIVSCGAKHSLYTMFQALLDDGDEVIVPAPYWVSYPDLVTLAGGRAILLPTRAQGQEGYHLRPETLRALLSPRTRALVLCSPSNPTGAVYAQAELQEIARLCVERDVWMISDDIYRSLVYGVAAGHVARCGEDARRRTILIDGVSKAYAMTGFRIGFCAGPRELVSAMEKLQSQSTSNPTSIAQAAALAAITGPQHTVQEMRLAFDLRRRRMLDLVRALPGVRVSEPHGAFYLFPDFSAVDPDDIALAKRLLEEAHVAVVPGTPFGAPGYLRLSYATSMDNIEEGMRRLGGALEARPAK